jgi:uncharacterized protein (TIGR03435 family)
MIRHSVLTLAVVAGGTSVITLLGQTPAVTGAQFAAVSIKPHTTGSASAMRMLPDGSQAMINIRISQIIGSAAPVPVVEVEGLPDWAMAERYDVIVKPGSLPTPPERAEMWRNMLIDRMKVVGHIDEVERITFSMVLARADGGLGPQLRMSTLDCSPGSPDAPRPAMPVDVRNKCTLHTGRGIVESGGIGLDYLARSLGGIVGGAITNRTGLDGFYALTLRYDARNMTPERTTPLEEGAPFFMEMEEQLGLKLVAGKTKVRVFVIDHIERPAPN